MGRRQPKPTPRGEAIRRLRQELGWSEGRLGKANRLSKGVIYNLENGWRKEPTRQEAEEIIAPMELPPAALDVSDAFGRWVQAAAPPPAPVVPEEEDERSCVVAAGLYGLHVARRVYPVLVRRARAERFARDRQQAAERLEHLRQLSTPQARRDRIENAEDYQTWAMVESLARKSERAAADTAAKAIEWAELALFAVRFVRGPESRRKRLEGYATFFLANALRVANDLDGADAAFSRAWALWKAGEADYLPLDEGRGLDLEASLRREQRLFPEALDLLKQALEVSPETGRILLKKAATLDQCGDVEAAVEALQQALPHVEKARELRDLKVLLFNFSVALRKLGKWKAAEELVASTRKVVLRLGGNELDLARTLWNEGLIDAGVGRMAKAATALEQVFNQLVSLGLPYDAALAGMDLAEVYLEQGHSREVMNLAGRMKAVFQTLGIEREALAAVLVFYDAARREEATVELARRTANIVKRVQRQALSKEGL